MASAPRVAAFFGVMERLMLAMRCSMELPKNIRRSMLFVCCVCVTWLVSPATGAVEAAGDAREQAQALFDAGLKRKEAGQGSAACELFEASVKLSPSPHGWLQVGLCREATDPAGAIAGFEAALATARAVPDASRRRAYESAARERIEKLAPRVPTVTFRRSPTAGVSVDMTASREKGIPVTEFDKPLRVNPGRYRVRARAAGRLSYLLDLELGPGQRHVVALPALEPVSRSTPAPSTPTVAATSDEAVPFAAEHVAPPAARQGSGSGFPVLPVVLVGSGAALVALGIGSGQLSSSARDELRQNCTEPDVRGQRRCGGDQAGTKARLERYALAADVLWISGVVLAGAGITLFVTKREPGQGTEVVAGCFAGGCGLSAAGRF